MSAVRYTRVSDAEFVVEQPTVRGNAWRLVRQSGGWVSEYEPRAIDVDKKRVRYGQKCQSCYEPNDPDSMEKVDRMNVMTLIRAAHSDIVTTIASEAGLNTFNLTKEERRLIINDEDDVAIAIEQSDCGDGHTAVWFRLPDGAVLTAMQRKVGDDLELGEIDWESGYVESLDGEERDRLADRFEEAEAKCLAAWQEI